jgi:uncharacterized protein (DUF1330 family)
VPAYVIFDEEILDPSRLETYKSLAGPSIARAGGRFLSRGGTITPLEGGWSPQRMVILEFDTVEQARAWYDSPDYLEARRAREGSLRMKALIIEST